MAKRRYLTKSRFKLATECPTKLFYTGKSQYANQNLDDSFLLALADGGFQVGDLAKCYFPGGHDIKTLDYDEALKIYRVAPSYHVVITMLKPHKQSLFTSILRFLAPKSAI